MNNDLFKSMNLNQLVEVEERIAKECKSKRKALIFWFFGSAFGLHRFYLGLYGTGLKLFTASFLSFGLAGIYVAIQDYRNLDQLIELSNEETLLNIIKDVKRV